ncbi:MAG: hypothetical protein ACI4OJ_12835 [Lachnospiraceae bacterium]
MGDNWKLAAAAAFVIPCCVRDLRKRSIPLWYFAIGAVAAGLWCVLDPPGREGIPALFASLLPGEFLLLCAFATRQKIGFGDGIFFLLLGLLVRDGTGMLLLLCLALLFSAAFSGILLAAGRVKKSTKLPFLPFAGAAAVVLLWRGGFPV